MIAEENQMKSVQATILSLWIISLPDTAYARNIILNCSDAVNLYAGSYVVEIDRKNSLIAINRHPFDSSRMNQVFQITNVESRGGFYTITADGKLFNAHMIIELNDDISIEYTDAFTNRPLSIDRCTSARAVKSKNK